MTNILKKVLITGLMLIVMINATGCNMLGFDADGYVEASLRAIYYQDYKDYAKFTGQNKKDAEAELKKAQHKEMKKTLGNFTTLEESDYEEYYQIVDKIYKKVKFRTVKMSKDDDKNYIVTLEIQPLDIMTKFNAGIDAKMLEAFPAEQAFPTEKDTLTFVSDYLDECLQSAAYQDKVTIEVHVDKEKGKVYSIRDEDLQKIEETLMPGI